MMKTKLTLLLGLVVGASINAQAAIISGYGVQASAGTASNCPSFCTTADGGDFQSNVDGGEFSNSATASENSYGSASATASYTGVSPTFLPTLAVDASSGLGRRADANAFGVQGYTYNGAATTITLDFNLHGSVGDNPSGYIYNNLRADIAVVTGSAMNWYPDYATLIFELVAFDPGLSVVGNETVFITDGVDVNAPGFISFDITDGMDFYVVASMGATAQNGFATALNTLSMQFDNDMGLTAASASVVPVPAAVWLFGSGLIGLIGVAKRKTNV